jgi:hypothetical protein
LVPGESALGVEALAIVRIQARDQLAPGLRETYASSFLEAEIDGLSRDLCGPQ